MTVDSPFAFPKPLFADLPADWKRKPLKRAVHFVEGPGIMAADFEDDGVPLLRIAGIGGRRASLDGCNFLSPVLVEQKWSHFCVKLGDLLISGSASTGLCAEVDERTCGAIPYTGIIIIRPVETQADRNFLRWFFLSEGFATQVVLAQTGSALKHFGPTHLSQMFIPLPPITIQRAIADYLDRETGRIDALIAVKERLLTLLAEKRQALITHAVTCGLNSDAPIRKSGIPWLGEVPAHWGVHRLKFHLPRIEQGWSPQCDNFPANDDEWGVLKVGAVNGWEFNPDENKRLPDDLGPIAEYEIHEGDVLMSRANTTQLLGRAALVRHVRPRLMFCDKHYRLTIDSNVLNSEFLVLYLRSTAGHFEFERDATGASNSMQNIGQDSVQNVWITVPPVCEQNDIVRYITSSTARMDATETANRRTLDLLRERRSALIAAAVTGQLDMGA